MANKKISELQSRTPALSDLILVGDPSSGYSYKCTVTALATIIETDIADGYVTIGTTQTISGAKTFSNNLTLTSVVNTPTDPDKFLTLNASNVVTYRTGAEVLSDIGGVGGSGTTNYLPKFSATTTLANSQIFDNGTNVGIGVGSSIIAGYLLTIGGKVKIYNQIDLDNPTTNTCNAINIQKGTSISHRGVGYIQIASFNTNRLSLFFNDNNNYQADFDGSNLTTGQRYILPNATGTLALTSDLSSYVPTSRILTINGTSYDLSANRTWSVGTVTSVAALTLGTTGTDLSSSVANGTTTPVITLNIPTASATNRGALSSTDWSTFNNKQSTITLTTTGSSGSATFVSNTLNVPTYTLAGLGGISGTGTTNYIPKFTSSSAIGNSAIYDASGSIGIGTSSPVANTPLTLQAASGYTDILWLKSAGTNIDARINMAPTGTGLAQLNNTNGTGIAFQISGGEQMRLTSTGLGIGTSSPGVKLEVIGSTLISTGGDNWFGYGSNKDNYFTTGTGSGVQIWRNSSGTEFMRLDASGNLGLGVTPSAWGALKSFDISTSGSFFGFSSQAGLSNNTYFNGSNWVYKNTASAAYFRATGSAFEWHQAGSGTAGNAISFTQAMTLDASGNLALGTTTVQNLASGRGNITIGGTSSSILNFSYNNSDNGYIFHNGDLNIVNRTSTGPIIFGAGSGSERMRITSGGNVGIGTSSPSAPLHLAGTSQLIRLQNDNAFIRFANTANTDLGYIQHTSSVFNIVTQSATASLVFGTNSSERMRITSGGLVGIGTSSPDHKLQVNQSIGGDIAKFVYTGGTKNPYIGLLANTDALMVLSANNSDNTAALRFDIAGAERMRITSGGNVGIGVTAPTELLHLRNAVGPSILMDDASGRSTVFRNVSTTTGAAIGTVSNHEFLFLTYNTERARFTSGGELLINTTSDAGDYKLQVNGAMYLATVNGANNSIVTDYTSSYTPLRSQLSGARSWQIDNVSGNFKIYIDGTLDAYALELNQSGNLIIPVGSIKTAAPSGGTAKPWKLGEAGVTLGGSNTSGVRVEIDGVVYYLVTGYLP